MRTDKLNNKIDTEIEIDEACEEDSVQEDEII